jgi:hypothetical protein
MAGFEILAKIASGAVVIVGDRSPGQHTTCPTSASKQTTRTGRAARDGRGPRRPLHVRLQP